MKGDSWALSPKLYAELFVIRGKLFILPVQVLCLQQVVMIIYVAINFVLLIQSATARASLIIGQIWVYLFGYFTCINPVYSVYCLIFFQIYSNFNDHLVLAAVIQEKPKFLPPL